MDLTLAPRKRPQTRIPPPEQYPNEEVTAVALCQSPYTGPSVTRTIAAGTYFSPIPGRATARALSEVQRAAYAALSCTPVPTDAFPFTIRVECGNYATVHNAVETDVEPGEFTGYMGQPLHEVQAAASAALAPDAWANELNCDTVVQSDLVGGVAVLTTLPFETQWVGGTWFSEPLEPAGRWRVA